MSHEHRLSIFGNPSEGYRSQLSSPHCPEAKNSAGTTSTPAVSEHAQRWQLWQTHQRHFYRLCLRWMNGDRERADEALQLAAIALWSKHDQRCHRVDNPMAWLTGLVRHTCLDLQRSQHRDRCRLYELDSAAAGVSAETLLICMSYRTPEAMILHRELCAYLFTEIANLPERLRKPLVLRVLHGIPYSAIAERLQLSAANARKCVQEARTVLASRFRLYQSGEAGPVGERGCADRWLDEVTLLRMESTEVVQHKADGRELLRPGVEQLPHPTKRELQKLRTLRTYVQRHPSGWKKRLALADQLCKLGYTEEALVTYQQVLAQKPHLLSVWLQVGHLCQFANCHEKASAAFERAFALAPTTEIRDVIGKLKKALK